MKAYFKKLKLISWVLAFGLFALNVVVAAHLHADNAHNSQTSCASCNALQNLSQSVTASVQDLNFFTTVVTYLVLLPGMDHPQFIFSYLPIRGPPAL